ARRDVILQLKCADRDAARSAAACHHIALYAARRAGLASAISVWPFPRQARDSATPINNRPEYIARPKSRSSGNSSNSGNALAMKNTENNTVSATPGKIVVRFSQRFAIRAMTKGTANVK